MSQHALADAPAAVKSQVQALVKALRESAGEALVGIYLHGSLALGCFNPTRSDIDVLVVTGEAMPRKAKEEFMGRLLALSGCPCPIELSALNEGQLRPWRHPTPFDLHFSEGLRRASPSEFADGSWIRRYDEEQRDDDLAAHITVARARGIRLWGRPAAEVLPEVPADDYVASLLSDMEWARGRPEVSPEHRVLNLCRVWAYLVGGRVLSKDEGGVWACPALPAGFRDTVETALRAYRGEGMTSRFEEAPLAACMEHLEERIRVLVSGRSGLSEKEGAA